MRAVLGLAPASYLGALRCEHACRLLGDRALSIEEVGRRVGIADPYLFSKVFKRVVGVSPR